MSIKDDAKYVKKELGADEKMLESALQLETFYKKHKIKIWATIGLIILFFGGRAVISGIQEAKLNSANKAFLTLQKDPKNSEALETLKSDNAALYELYSYARAIKSEDAKTLEQFAGSKNPLIADISTYHSSVLAKKGSNSQYYKEMSLIEDAYLALKAGKVKEAKAKLDMIDARSPVASVADLLKHYTIKAQ
ncbi:MAG: hypothetical protein U9Q90_02680 [Campylobacterota bacterium]|nr:hypothetical protein [Campylobacterota bacterium]